jgi:hypothetical protein
MLTQINSEICWMNSTLDKKFLLLFLGHPMWYLGLLLASKTPQFLQLANNKNNKIECCN